MEQGSGNDMANVNVTYSEMRDAASRLEMGKGNLDEILADLMRQVTTLVSSGFVTDQASTQFMASYDQFNLGAKNAVEGLVEMHTFLARAADSMEELDARLGSSIAR
jgi:WXG100 family type VII secretion target